MEILRDVFYTNKRVAKKAAISLGKNWPIIFTGLFYFIATSVVSMVSRGFWILGGLISIIATSALISSYLYLLNVILRRGKFDFEDFKDGFTVYLRKLWTILFMGYVAMLILSLVSPILINTIGAAAVNMIIITLSFILFNPIPEATYQKYYDPWETITYTVEFVRENWIEWFIPNIALLAIFYFMPGPSLNILSFISNVFNYFISFNSFNISIIGFVIYLLSQIWFSYFMIYRAYLFEELTTSNRRKRLFMREF